MTRLEERAGKRLRSLRQMRTIMLLVVSLVILTGLVLNIVSTFYLVDADLEGWRQIQVLVNAMSVLVDLIVLLLAWVIFDALTRIEREADRLQTFMDNVYRRLP